MPYEMQIFHELLQTSEINKEISLYIIWRKIAWFRKNSDYGIKVT